MIFVVRGWDHVGVDPGLLDSWLAQRRTASDAAWRARRQWKRRAREEFAEARKFGLAARHAAKLERIHASCTVAADGTVHCVDDPPYDAICPRRPTAPATATAARPARAADSRPATATDSRPTTATVNDARPAVSQTPPPVTVQRRPTARPPIAVTANPRPAVPVPDSRPAVAQIRPVALPARPPAAVTANPRPALTVSDTRPAAAQTQPPAEMSLTTATVADAPPTTGHTRPAAPAKPPAATAANTRTVATVADARPPAATQSRRVALTRRAGVAKPRATVTADARTATAVAGRRPATARRTRSALRAVGGERPGRHRFRDQRSARGPPQRCVPITKQCWDVGAQTAKQRRRGGGQCTQPRCRTHRGDVVAVTRECPRWTPAVLPL